jgi:DNA-binding LacI/PurR family transcriptional regulator
MSSPSLRQLAHELGVSHTTVSEALRGSPRVKPETKDMILKAANALGYQRNPLAGALMSEMRRSRAGTFRGVLAVLDLDGAEGRPPGPTRYHAELTKGATQRAEELGFKADVFSVGKGGLSLERLDTILQSRGIRGIFLLPVRETPDLTRLGWGHFSGIYSDYVIERPGLHAVCPDHYRAMLTAMDRLRAQGYQRPGLVLGAAHDERLLFRWEAAYHAYQTHHDGMTRLPPLIMSELNQEDFTRWFTTVKCDVVLAHNPLVMEWMKAAGASVPKTHGFCCLNVLNSEKPCAGLDLQPRLLGARGVELLISQVLCNEVGAPEVPMTTVLPAAWVDGPTVRAQLKKGARPQARAIRGI